MTPTKKPEVVSSMDFTSKLPGNNEPVLTVRDAARYRTVLLAKRDELAATAEGAECVAPPANDKSGDLIDWARADTEAAGHRGGRTPRRSCRSSGASRMLT